MRTIRSITAVGLAAVTILSLTACTPASKEDQAIEQFNKFLAATNGDGEINYCDDIADGLRMDNVEPSRLDENTELEAHTYSDNPNRVDILASVGPTDGDRTDYFASLWVNFPEGKQPCVMGGTGFSY